MLRLLLDKVSVIYDKQPYLEALFKAIFVTAYYGLMQVGKIAESAHSLKAIDIHSANNKEKILIIFKYSGVLYLSCLVNKEWTMYCCVQ